MAASSKSWLRLSTLSRSLRARQLVSRGWRQAGALSARSFASSVPIASESVSEHGVEESHKFQAETRQLLDIVAGALYTDRHIFVRELVSNCSDALEKLRHRTAAGDPVMESARGMQIRISTNEADNTFVIEDDGIGMSHDELIENIGTIAHSGSKAFLRKATEAGLDKTSLGHNLIGQFGVGFYSAFMVADSITVYSRSADETQPGHVWRSVGDGTFTIRTADGLERGTKIVLKLKNNAREFASAKTVEDIIKRYSNFVGFPIYLNEVQVNTVAAIWTEPKHTVSEEQYLQFYRFKSGQEYATPQMRLHFFADAPISMRALLYVPELNEEGFGLGRMRPGVDLYSRKVLIEAESRILPEWLRFLKGVVDSEEIPLNISRESMQDTALMLRIKAVLTRRILRFLEGEMRRDRKQYEGFFSEFGMFLKEGVCSDPTYQADIGRLMLFESSALPAGQLTTLDEYIARCPPGQDKLYYLVAPHRGLAESSPYMEAFKGAGSDKRDVEVLFAYSSIDDFVFQQLGQHNGRQVVTAEAGDLGLSTPPSKEPEPAQSESDTPARLSDSQVAELGEWLSSVALKGKIKEVRPSARLRTTPAVVVDHESASVRRMMKIMDASKRDAESPSAADQVLARQTLEVNPSHPIIRSMWSLRDKQPSIAKATAEQVFDNALIAAGLLDDARTMLPRLNKILETMLSVSASEATVDIGSDHAGLSKRFVEPQEEAFLASRDIAEEVLQEELLKQAKAAPVQEEEPEVLRVGPDGRLMGKAGGLSDPGEEDDAPRR
jgi:TNF receptor-associated protein 1